MMRIPSLTKHPGNKLFSLTMGSEIVNPLESEMSNAFSINKTLWGDTELAISWTQLNKYAEGGEKDTEIGLDEHIGLT